MNEAVHFNICSSELMNYEENMEWQLFKCALKKSDGVDIVEL